jgi:hypothetical protein
MPIASVVRCNYKKKYKNRNNMATPRVFVSSTCYDLKEIRDNLYEFIDSLGYIPVFSDKNEVFYHPDLHSHEACLKEIENCQLFILIIGGRFGGTYKYDETKSIVNAEYDTAKKLELPIFTFVQKDVYSNQLTYSKNIASGIADKIEYPAIADQKYAKNIFDFIISIRRSDENNGLFEFEFTRDIKDILRKQFAGLFYDFLWNRKKIKESDSTRNILFDLSSISKKTEELIQNIYQKVEDKDSSILINQLDLEDKARKFWYLQSQIFNISLWKTKPSTKVRLSKVDDSETDWIRFLTSKTEKFEIIEIGDEKKARALFHNNTKRQFAFEWADTKEIYEPNEREIKLLEKYFDSYKKLTEERRLELLNEFEM